MNDYTHAVTELLTAAETSNGTCSGSVPRWEIERNEATMIYPSGLKATVTAYPADLSGQRWFQWAILPGHGKQHMAGTARTAEAAMGAAETCAYGWLTAWKTAAAQVA